MTEEDEEFNRIERESRVRQEYIKEMTRQPIGLSVPHRDMSNKPTQEQLIAKLRAEIVVLTELVRVLSDRVKELEKSKR